jgi:hypothetical protein
MQERTAGSHARRDVHRLDGHVSLTGGLSHLQGFLEGVPAALPLSRDVTA